jgi:hypothetical protein
MMLFGCFRYFQELCSLECTLTDNGDIHFLMDRDASDFHDSSVIGFAFEDLFMR